MGLTFLATNVVRSKFPGVHDTSDLIDVSEFQRRFAQMKSAKMQRKELPERRRDLVGRNAWVSGHLASLQLPNQSRACMSRIAELQDHRLQGDNAMIFDLCFSLTLDGARAPTSYSLT